MKDQVLSIEQMQELQELGVDTSKASCCWCKLVSSNRIGYAWLLLPESLNKMDETHVPTFTLQDILETLPKYIEVTEEQTDKSEYLGTNRLRIGCPEGIDDMYIMYTKDSKMNGGWSSFNAKPSLIKAAFNMLKWCKENNYI